MKSAIIFLLLVALLAAAALSKPSQEDFQRYMTAKSTQGDTNVLKAGWDQYQAESYVKSCTFNNRILWMDVQKDGKTIYTGAFAHWFNRDTVAAEMKNVKDDVKGIKDKIPNVKIETTK